MSVVLVTGGAGYIGSHACKALVGAGHTPVTYDNLCLGHRRAVKWGPLIEADIADREALDVSLSQWRPDAVMHFAAYAAVGESVADPGKYYRNNVAGTLTLLEAMRDHGIDRLIFSSTCATYGVPQYSPIDEQHPQRPINPYGTSKLMVEQMLADFAHAHGLRATSLRYFNAAGADAEAGIGETPGSSTRLIPLAIEAVLGGPALAIHGDDYETPDGTCIRDYIHVDDLAQAHVLALAGLANAPPGLNNYNLGTGRGFSVREVLAAVERVSGQLVPTSIGPRRPGDPAILFANARRAQLELGWSPKFTELDAIVASAWDWALRGAHDDGDVCPA